MQTQTNPLQELLTGLEQISINLASESISRKVIMLMGQTKAGKTTLYYYLSGKKLILEKNENEVWQLTPQAKFCNANIGNTYESETVYPNIPPFEDEEEVMVIDMPGFDDSRHNYRLLNIAILLQTLKLMREVHICHVIPYQFVSGDQLVREFQKISGLFKKQILCEDHYLSFIMTKVEQQGTDEVFLGLIDDIMGEGIETLEVDIMRAFKLKHLYQFKSKEPEVQQGLQLRSQLINENSFIDTNHTPSVILSQDYSIQMVGKNSLGEFTDYLMEIIEHISLTLEPLLAVFVQVVRVELQPIMGKEEEWEDVVKDLLGNTLKIRLYGIQGFAFEGGDRNNPNKSQCITFLKCLKRPKQPLTLIQHFLSFSHIIAQLRKQRSQLQEDFLQKIQKCLKEMSSLILIIKQVRIAQVQQKIDTIIENQSLKALIAEHFAFWEVNQSCVLASETFERLSNDQEVIELMEELGISAAQEKIIQLISKYQQPRNKQIKKLIQNARKNEGKQGYMEVQYEDYTSLIPILLKSKVNDLPTSSSSLKHLKSQFQLLKQKQEKLPIRIILDKIADIFYWFSFFEQAIMFKICTLDQNSIHSLLEEGMQQEQISPQFIKDILIPYYSQANPDLSKLDLCFNYLLYLTPTLQIQQKRCEAMSLIFSSPENAYLIADRYSPLEFYYINPIMQNFEYYLQETERRRSLFVMSPISSLKSFINERMRP